MLIMGDTFHVQNEGNMEDLDIFPSIFLWTFNCSLKSLDLKKKLHHLFGPHVLQNNGILISIYEVINNRIFIKEAYFLISFFFGPLWRRNWWHGSKDLPTWWCRHCHKFASAIKFTKMAFQHNLFSEEWASLCISKHNIIECTPSSTFHSHLTLQTRSLEMDLIGCALTTKLLAICYNSVFPKEAIKYTSI